MVRGFIISLLVGLAFEVSCANDLQSGGLKPVNNNQTTEKPNKQIKKIGEEVAAMSPLLESLEDTVENETESMKGRWSEIEEEIRALEKAVKAIQKENKKLKNQTNQTLEQALEDCQAAYCRRRVENPHKITYQGKAGADSEWGSGSGKHIAANAFTPSPQNGKPWASGNEKLPQKVWYKFNVKKTVSKISFSSRKSAHLYQAPKTFYIMASDDCSSWKNLLYVADADFTATKQTKTFTIPCNEQGAFFCYAINTLESQGSKTLVAIANVIMYD